MLNYSKASHTGRFPASACLGSLITASIMAAVLLTQSACFFNKKKVKPEAVATAPVRLVLLPFNVPSDAKDLRWTAMAAPILMAMTGQKEKGLEILPLWQTMPTALTAAGSSRTFTEESASTVAAWSSAKWSVMGEFTPAKNGVSMMLDFIPARINQVPFRFLKAGKLDEIGNSFYEAYLQFLRYLVSRPPIQQVPSKDTTMTSVKDLAQALDREYGWSVEAEPGKAQEAVARLMQSDENLARMLFSPSLYPVLGETEKK